MTPWVRNGDKLRPRVGEWGLLVVSYSSVLLLMQLTVVRTQIYKYFSKPEDCTTTNETWEIVSSQDMFVLQDEVPGETAGKFRTCQINLVAKNPDFRLCVQNRKLVLEEYYIKLEIYDGLYMKGSDMKPNKTAEDLTMIPTTAKDELRVRKSLSDQNDFRHNREWCTSGQNLTIRLKQNGASPKYSEVDVVLYVYTLQNFTRSVSLGTQYCAITMLMDSSFVKVQNFDPLLPPVTIYPICKITFKYVGKEEKRSICISFEESPGNEGCQKLNYTLELRDTPYEEEEKGNRTVWTCQGRASGSEPQLWCANTSLLDMRFERKNQPITKTEEVVFSAFILDKKIGATPKVKPSVPNVITITTLGPTTKSTTVNESDTTDDDGAEPGDSSFTYNLGLYIGLGLFCVVLVVGLVGVYLKYRRRASADPAPPTDDATEEPVSPSKPPEEDGSSPYDDSEL